jgi:hypothetical protein
MKRGDSIPKSENLLSALFGKLTGKKGGPPEGPPGKPEDRPPGKPEDRPIGGKPDEPPKQPEDRPIGPPPDRPPGGGDGGNGPGGDGGNGPGGDGGNGAEGDGGNGPTGEVTEPPEEKKTLTGIRSTFFSADNVIELYMHVESNTYSNKIYDIEILPNVQDPPWKTAEGLKAPEGWKYEKMDDGVRFFTQSNPLLKCQRTKFRFKFQATTIPESIRVHITSRDHTNMGIVLSTKW